MAAPNSDVNSSNLRAIVLTLMLISALALLIYSLSRPNWLRNWINNRIPAASTQSKQKNDRSLPVTTYYARSDLPVYKYENFSEEIMTLARGSRVTGIFMSEESKINGRFFVLEGARGFVDFEKLSRISRPLIENASYKISIGNNFAYEEPDSNSRRIAIKDGDEVEIFGFVSDKNIFQEITINKNSTAYIKISDIENKQKYIDIYYFGYILNSNLSQEIKKIIRKLEPDKKIVIGQIGNLPILTAYLHIDSDAEGGDGYYIFTMSENAATIKKILNDNLIDRNKDENYNIPSGCGWRLSDVKEYKERNGTVKSHLISGLC